MRCCKGDVNGFMKVSRMYFKVKRNSQQGNPTCNTDVKSELPLTKSDQINLFFHPQIFQKELAFDEAFTSK